MPAIPIPPGTRFTRLIIIGPAKPAPNYQHKSKCRCDCGNEVEVKNQNLRNGTTRSCGCLKKEHGPTNFRHGYCVGDKASGTYNSWSGMKDRCLNPKCKKFPSYGGRGIKLCKRWMTFISFLEDMGDRPEGMSIERINNNGNYEPGNCKWATPIEQASNRRKNRLLTTNGVTMTLSQWSRKLNVSEACIRGRIKRGWSMDAALLP